MLLHTCLDREGGVLVVAEAKKELDTNCEENEERTKDKKYEVDTDYVVTRIMPKRKITVRPLFLPALSVIFWVFICTSFYEVRKKPAHFSLNRGCMMYQNEGIALNKH